VISIAETIQMKNKNSKAKSVELNGNVLQVQRDPDAVENCTIEVAPETDESPDLE